MHIADRRKESNKKWRDKYPDYNAEWRIKNPKYHQTYYQNNKTKIISQVNKYNKKIKKQIKNKMLKDIIPTTEQLDLMHKGIYAYLGSFNYKRPSHVRLLKEDCISAAYEGLLGAIYNYYIRDKKTKIKSDFNKYCIARVKCSLIDDYRKEFGRKDKETNGTLNMAMVPFSVLDTNLSHQGIDNENITDIIGEDKKNYLSVEDKELSNKCYKNLRNYLLEESRKKYRSNHEKIVSIYFLFYIFGYKMQEIGDMLKLSESRVSQLLIYFLRPAVAKYKEEQHTEAPVSL